MRIYWSTVLMLAAQTQAAPLQLEFLKGCSPDGGRKEAYNSAVDEFQLKMADIGRFRIKEVERDLANRRVVFRISGMLDRPEGPLELQVNGRKYSLHHVGYDPTLFRIQRKNGVTEIEFLAKGKELLLPGAVVQYIDFYRG